MMRISADVNVNGHAQVQAATTDAGKADWRSKAKPIKEGSTYPAKQFCSHCGLCDTYYIAHVKDACAFLGDGEIPLLLPCGQPHMLSRLKARDQK